MKHDEFSIEKIRPILKAGKVVRAGDHAEYVSAGGVSQFPNTSLPYLEAFASGLCIHDVIHSRFEKGENINFAEIKETLSALYWNGDLQNDDAFRSYIELVDGPPEKTGYLTDPFFELSFSSASPVEQLVGIGVLVAILAATFKLWTSPDILTLSVLLVPQTFFTVKTLLATGANFLMNTRSQALSLHVSLLGIYLKPSNRRPHAISDGEYYIRSLLTVGLFLYGATLLQQMPLPIFKDLGLMLLILAAGLCFSPTHNSDVSNFRRFSYRRSPESNQFVLFLSSGAYFAICLLFLWFTLDILVQISNVGVTQDIALRGVHFALLASALGLLFDMVDDFESLGDRPVRFLPRGFSLRENIRDAMSNSNRKINVAAALENIPLLQTLPPHVLAEMAKVSEVKSFKPGVQIIRDGDTSTDLYIVAQGQVGVYRKKADGRRECAAQLNEGSIFGEAGFFLKRQRVGDVYTNTQAILIRIRRPDNFDVSNKLTSSAFAMFQRKIWGFQTMAASEMFKDTPTEIIRTLAQQGELVEIADRRIIFQQGDVADALWIIVQGTCSAVIAGKPVRSMHTGDIFGEIGILRKSKRTAQVVTVTPVVLLKIDSIHLWEILSCSLNLGLTIQAVAHERFFSQSA